MGEFLDELRESIERDRLIAPGDRIVVAVSGGADSMALLHGLRRLNDGDGWGLTLHVAHLHHGIRGDDADADERFVREQAESLRLPSTTERVDVPREAASRGVSVETAGRILRYAFFERVATDHDAGVVAVGHHADDNAETILHRLFRGTGWRGLGGMRPSRRLSPHSRVRLVRPLLAMRRDTLRRFLTDLGVPWREDATNRTRSATRNRIRLDLMPMIERAINPRAVEALGRMARQASELYEFLRVEANRAIAAATLDRRDDAIELDASVLSALPAIVRAEALRRAIARLRGTHREPGADHLWRLMRLVSGDERALDMPGGIRAVRSGDRLTLLPLSRACDAAAWEVPLAVPGRTVIADAHIELDAAVEPCDRAASGGAARVERLAWEAITPPLTVRRYRAGERFQPLGMSASKKIARFLLDAKVPRSQRRCVPVLCDRRGPLWVIPHRIDERVRVTEQTRQVLRIGWSTS